MVKILMNKQFNLSVKKLELFFKILTINLLAISVSASSQKVLVPREKMEELIKEYTKKVDMDKYLEREPVTLSGGQKQRVAIAGILALDCETIILDEATSMLDPEGTKEIIELIKVLREKYNKTIITITHDLELARLSDHIIVLRNGSIIKDGTAEEILEERELLLSSNLDMPFSLKVDYLAKNDPILSKNEKLMEALWEFRLKK